VGQIGADTEGQIAPAPRLLGSSHKRRGLA
jgi:hypothetical protein